jgi:hypothetical protein
MAEPNQPNVLYHGDNLDIPNLLNPTMPGLRRTVSPTLSVLFAHMTLERTRPGILPMFEPYKPHPVLTDTELSLTSPKSAGLVRHALLRYLRGGT